MTDKKQIATLPLPLPLSFYWTLHLPLTWPTIQISPHIFACWKSLIIFEGKVREEFHLVVNLAPSFWCLLRSDILKWCAGSEKFHNDKVCICSLQVDDKVRRWCQSFQGLSLWFNWLLKSWKVSHFNPQQISMSCHASSKSLVTNKLESTNYKWKVVKSFSP